MDPKLYALMTKVAIRIELHEGRRPLKGLEIDLEKAWSEKIRFSKKTGLSSVSFFGLAMNLDELTEERIDDLCRLGVTSLDLSCNHIITVHDSLGYLGGLTSLYLSHNMITQLPESMGSLLVLEKLMVNDNKLSSLPESMAKCQNLRVLYIDGNMFTSVPDVVTRLVNLSTLYLSRNALEYLPDDLEKLVNIENLYVQGNKLTQLPDSFENLSTLKKLTLHKNKLTTASLCDVAKLLRHNQLRYLHIYENLGSNDTRVVQAFDRALSENYSLTKFALTGMGEIVKGHGEYDEKIKHAIEVNECMAAEAASTNK